MAYSSTSIQHVYFQLTSNQPTRDFCAIWSVVLLFAKVTLDGYGIVRRNKGSRGTGLLRLKWKFLSGFLIFKDDSRSEMPILAQTIA